MEVSGRIVKSLPKQTGPSKKGGTWTRHQVLIETEGQYPKQIVVDIYDDKAAPLKTASAGTLVNFSVDLSSREYKGSYYTSVTAYKVELASDTVATAKAQPQRASVARQPSMPAHSKRQAQTTSYEVDPASSDDADDNLPF